MRSLCKALDEARREQWLWSRGVHEKQIGTRWEYGSPETPSTSRSRRRRRSGRPRRGWCQPTSRDLVETSGRRSGWSGTASYEPPSSGYDRPPEVANADVGGVGERELAGA